MESESGPRNPFPRAEDLQERRASENRLSVLNIYRNIYRRRKMRSTFYPKSKNPRPGNRGPRSIQARLRTLLAKGKNGKQAAEALNLSYREVRKIRREEMITIFSVDWIPVIEIARDISVDGVSVTPAKLAEYLTEQMGIRVSCFSGYIRRIRLADYHKVIAHFEELATIRQTWWTGPQAARMWGIDRSSLHRGVTKGYEKYKGVQRVKVPYPHKTKWIWMYDPSKPPR